MFEQIVPFLHYHSYLRRYYIHFVCCIYFVEYTTQMNKNTVLFFCFAILAYHCSSRCILSSFSFVACLSSLLYSSLCSLPFSLLCSLAFLYAVVACFFSLLFLASLPSQCFPLIFSLLSSHCFFLVVVLFTYFRSLFSHCNYCSLMLV